jgi:hypothetical protein
MRKGLVYSVIAIMLFSLIVVLTLSQSILLNTAERSTTNKLAGDFMMSFAATVDRDYDKALDVSSRRAIVSAVNYVMNGSTISSAEEVLEELITNGTLNGTAQPLLEENSISYWLAKMQARGSAAGLKVSMGVTNFSVGEYDNFNLWLNTTISLNISGPSATLSKVLRKSTTVGIENFTDPFYAFQTQGLVPRTISRSPYSNYSAFVLYGQNASGSQTGWTVVALNSSAASGISNKSAKILVTTNGSAINQTVASQFAGVVAEAAGSLSVSNYLTGATSAIAKLPDGTYIFLDSTSKSAWNKTRLDQLDDTINHGFYNPSSDGPGFLDRLEMHFNNTRTYGLETIVSLPELEDKSLPVYTNTTLVDHFYFKNATVPGKSVRSLYYTWFKVDSGHEVFYGVNSTNRSLT